MKKSCSHCAREVPANSKAGEKCPHCGVYWSDEKEFKPIPAYEPSEEVIRRNLWIKIEAKIIDKIPQQEKDALYMKADFYLQIRIGLHSWKAG